MSNNARNTYSLNDFQMQTRKHLRRLKKTGEPEILTLNGHGKVIVQSPEGYQELLEKADLADSVRTLRKRAGDRRGKDIPAETVLAQIRERLGMRNRSQA